MKCISLINANMEPKLKDVEQQNPFCFYIQHQYNVIDIALFITYNSHKNDDLSIHINAIVSMNVKKYSKFQMYIL